MNLAELLRAVGTAAQTGGDPARCEALVRETERLADMVGWAVGPIDPQGEWLDRLAAVQADVKLHYTRSGDPILALLHDALTDLGRAIARHDEDVEAHRADDGDDDIA